MGPEDLRHLRKLERWGRACTVLGYVTAGATAWLVPNPLSALLLSQGRLMRWTMFAHHVCHRGYDRVPEVPRRRTSAVFARGWRRLVDWLDWLDPEAWSHEHNRLHHYRLGELADPDLVERNLDWLRRARLPRALKLAVIAFFATTWKWSYYAPNTWRALKIEQARRAGDEHFDIPSHVQVWGDPAFLLRCVLPYAAVTFAVIPGLFAALLGPQAGLAVLLTSVLAELFTNIHGFVVITTNHAGADVQAFSGPVTGGKAEFYWRQVVGSVNFRTGGDLNDALHGFLNYQIEHHLFPELTMRQYQRIAPRVKALCAEYGVPYLQESVWRRLGKTVAVMIGEASQARSSGVPVDDVEAAEAAE